MGVSLMFRPSARALCLSSVPQSASALKLSSAISGGRDFAFSSTAVPVVAVVKPQVRYLSTQKEIQENIKNFKEGKFDTIPDPGHLEHFRGKSQRKPEEPKDTSSFQAAAETEKEPPMGAYSLPHPIWSEEQLHDVKITHKPPEGILDRMAYATVKLLRGGFDIFSGFSYGERNEKKWIKRIIFLETVAGVPGMVAAMMRHMMSLRRLQRDHGWIHTLLEEAENERMHLMTALQLRQPSMMFRTAVIGSQGVFVSMFFLWYAVSPRFCHRFVGYLEEEAVKTYTKCLEDISTGPMQHWKRTPAPLVAVRYWKLPEDATMRDVILAIRADEAHHRVVNHTLASLKPDEFNPYKPGQ